jgi:hypothetical protein
LLSVVVETLSAPAELGTDTACDPDALPALSTSSFDPSVNAKVNPASLSPGEAYHP